MESSDTAKVFTYPRSFETKTGFDNIRKHIADSCLSDLGRHYVNNMQAVTQLEKIALFLGQTMEFTTIIQRYNFPTEHYYDLRADIEKLKTPGVYIMPPLLLRLIRTLQTIENIFSFFAQNNDNSFPLLSKLASAYYFDKSIITSGLKIIDENEEIKDSASPYLSELRQKRRQLVASREKKLAQIYAAWLKDGFASDTGITIRNGRMVIPVAAAYKRQVKGFICDESATGQTVYIEPAALIEINNDITDNENEERKEIIRILAQFTDELRPEFQNIQSCFSFLGTLDFIRAKARFAATIQGVFPQLEQRPFIDWKEARHPLLVLRSKDLPRGVVPMDLSINDTQRIIIVSGPNSGGKSVCLKTAGLVQYMLQCGIPVPMAPHSVCGIFRKIFIEIGDEQSLENDLSTYSSHLRNMAWFTAHSTPQTLFLIDEMGSGTEPQMGGAIAETIVEELHAKGAYGLLTTHYTNLKLLPGRLDAIKGAAMLFDTAKLEPRYVLKIGEHGSSFAFEIARKIGLPDNLVSRARQKLDAGIAGIEDYYNKVRAQDKELSDKLSRVNASDALLNETYNKYKKLLDALEADKQTLLDKARRDAHTILEEANRKVEHVIKTIRENQAEKEITKEARASLNALKEELKPPTPTPIQEPLVTQQNHKKDKRIIQQKPVVQHKTEDPGLPLKAGDYVLMDGQSGIGTVEEVKGKNISVAFGDIRIKVPLLRLRKLKDYTPPKNINRSGMAMIEAISEKQKQFSSVLDLRGKRAEDALRILDTYLHDALLCGVTPVNILHGKGDGILRKLIREALKMNPFVKKYGDAHVELGGQGITVVEVA